MFCLSPEICCLRIRALNDNLGKRCLMGVWEVGRVRVFGESISTCALIYISPMWPMTVVGLGRQGLLYLFTVSMSTGQGFLFTF